MTACLCVEDWNGKVFVSLYADKKMIPDWVNQKRELGTVRLVDIADADLGFGLDILRRLYLQQIDTKPKTEEQAKAEAELSAKSEAERIKMSKSELLRILDGIIRTSNQEGERDTALAMYRKFAGKDWRC